MKLFLFKRITHLFLVLIGVSILIFLLLSFTPGDPARMILLSSGIIPTAANLQQLKTDLGLNLPLYQQYFFWLGRVLHGDLGCSYQNGLSVVQEIINRFPATLELALASISFALLLAFPLGIISALKQNSIIDHLIRLWALLGTSLPNFWLGLLLIYLFALRLSLLPITGQDGLTSIILPAVTLGTGLAGVYSRILRASILEVLREDYILAARARGIKERQIIFKHALRNAIIPFTTLTGMSFGYLLGGSVIVEKIFSWPGIGMMIVDAIFARDYPLIQGYVIFLAVIFVILNLLVDCSCKFFNPQIYVEEE